MDCRESERIRGYIFYFLSIPFMFNSCGRIGSRIKAAVLHPASLCELVKPLIYSIFSLLCYPNLALVQPSSCHETV